MEERPGKGKHLALDSPHRRKEAALHQLPAKGNHETLWIYKLVICFHYRMCLVMVGVMIGMGFGTHWNVESNGAAPD
jgi:hypothetical protein